MEKEPGPQTPENKKQVDVIEIHNVPHYLETEISPQNQVISACVKTLGGEILKYTDVQGIREINNKRKLLQMMGININDDNIIQKIDANDPDLLLKLEGAKKLKKSKNHD